MAERAAAGRSFYGQDQASIHHQQFGDLAEAAAERLVEELRSVGLRTGTVVDLGCGSGILARTVSKAGYQVFGVDLSADMIALARREAPSAELAVGSVHDVEIPPAVGVTAIGEVLNYAADPSAGLVALARLAERARRSLETGGVFLFDVATPGRHGPTGRRTVFHDHADWSLAMEAEETDGTLDRRIVVFRQTEGGSYRRTDEHHVLRLYDPATVLDVVGRAGFDVTQEAGYASRATRSTPAQGWCVFVARARATDGPRLIR